MDLVKAAVLIDIIFDSSDDEVENKCVTSRVKRKTKRKYWVHPYLRNRMLDGAFVSIFGSICETNDPQLFLKYLRMTASQFEELLHKIGPSITKQNIMREAISAKIRLLITIRYLATGESQASLALSYKCSASVVHNILVETTSTIAKVLKKEVFPKITVAKFLEIAHGFEQRWNFPNCIGAIDGKHVMVTSPYNSGSEFFNYKKFFSIVLMAICDHDYNFIMCDVGAAGRQSDGGIFQNSEFGKLFYQNKLPIPKPRDVAPDLLEAPYVFVADDAFSMNENMMKPYSKRSLTKEERIYNYRLSRARRVIENSFGILSAKWRIYRVPINASLALVEDIVGSTVCLHNWLRNHPGNRYITMGSIDQDVQGHSTEGSWREQSNNLRAFHDRVNGNSSTKAKMTRNKFTKYFNNSGAVDWQDSKI